MLPSSLIIELFGYCTTGERENVPIVLYPRCEGRNKKPSSMKEID